MSSKVLYAIFSHTNSLQVLRLIRTIRTLSPNSLIIVHHDPTGTHLSPTDIEAAGALAVPNPIPGEWGDFSLVRQHLRTTQWAIDNFEFSWLVVLTGQSYPLHPLQEFEKDLNASCYDAYIHNFNPYDQNIWPNNEARIRYHYRYIKIPRFRYWHRLPNLLLKTFNTAVRLINNHQKFISIKLYPKGLPTRIGFATFYPPFDTSFPLIGANLNVTYRRNVIDYVLDFVSRNHRYVRHFERTAIPDEAFFSTIICNNPSLKISNSALRYIAWPSPHAASVGIIDISHLVALESSTAPFGLKFDESVCPQILDILDARLGVRRQSNA